MGERRLHARTRAGDGSVDAFGGEQDGPAHAAVGAQGAQRLAYFGEVRQGRKFVKGGHQIFGLACGVLELAWSSQRFMIPDRRARQVSGRKPDFRHLRGRWERRERESAADKDPADSSRSPATAATRSQGAEPKSSIVPDGAVFAEEDLIGDWAAANRRRATTRPTPSPAPVFLSRYAMYSATKISRFHP